MKWKPRRLPNMNYLSIVFKAHADVRICGLTTGKRKSMWKALFDTVQLIAWYPDGLRLAAAIYFLEREFKNKEKMATGNIARRQINAVGKHRPIESTKILVLNLPTLNFTIPCFCILLQWGFAKYKLVWAPAVVWSEKRNRNEPYLHLWDIVLVFWQMLSCKLFHRVRRPEFFMVNTEHPQKFNHIYILGGFFEAFRVRRSHIELRSHKSTERFSRGNKFILNFSFA